MGWRSIIGLSGTIVFVAALAYFFDWSALGHSFANLSLGVAASAMGLSLASIVFLSMRWAILAAPAAATIGWREFRDAFLAQMISLLTPAAVGADAYRVAIAGDREGGRARAMGLVLFERIVGVAVYAYVFLAAFAAKVAFAPAGPVFTLSAMIFAGFGLAFIIFLLASRLFARKLAAWFKRRQYAKIAATLEAATIVAPSRLVLAIAFSLLATGTWLTSIAILGFAVNVGLTAADLTMAGIVTEFSRLLPISIQGIGVREATFASLAREAGGDPNAALVASATAYVLHSAVMVGAGATARLAGGLRRIGV